MPEARHTKAVEVLGVGALALAFACTVRLLLDFPVMRVELGIGYLIAVAVVAWRPVLLWLIVPAALPVLDLAPWSGRLLVDEYDFLLAMLSAMAWWRSSPLTGVSNDRLVKSLLGLVLLSYGVSTARALWPWPGFEGLVNFNIFGPFNALRIMRGVIWACLLWLLAERQRASGLSVDMAFSNGLIVGLFGTVIFVMWERASFTEILDFRDGYRVAGPISAMHTGGAYIEAFLVTALPFFLIYIGKARSVWRWLLSGVFLATASYAIAVTFSRGGYISFALTLPILTISQARLRCPRRSHVLGILALAAVVCAAFVPVLTGSFSQSRWAAVDRDFLNRDAHWKRMFALVDGDVISILLGMGVGTLPRIVHQNSPLEERSSDFSLLSEPERRFLRLGSGKAVYIEQFASVDAKQNYRLQVQLRAATRGASLSVALCEKWLIASAACVSTSIPVDASEVGWQPISVPVFSGDVGAARSGLTRPVKLSFYSTGKVPVDVAEVQLVAPDGTQLLRNPRFTSGMDHWFFTADHHLAWHAKSMPLALYFDQGLMGLLVMGALLATSLFRAGRAVWRGRQDAAAMLAALVAFSAVGAVDSLIDTPRFVMLWLLLCCFAAEEKLLPIRPEAGSSDGGGAASAPA